MLPVIVTVVVSGGFAAVASPLALIDAMAELEDAHDVVAVTSFWVPSL